MLGVEMEAGGVCAAAEVFDRKVAVIRGAEIRKHNQTRLTNFTIQLREHLTYPVIDPGLLRVSGWAGKDYGSFFLEVMEQYAKEAWFIDGWEFSYGATREFLFFTSLGRPCINERGEDLSVEAGKDLIRVQ
jgi:hypothetical protein